MADKTKLKSAEGEDAGWGIEQYPYPEGFAYISARWDICIGCGACEMACAMAHYGVINREMSRIRIFRYLLPLPKSVQNVCAQCREEERECQKACPLDPPVISFDTEKLHMVVDSKRCLGHKCGQCRKACPADVPRFYPEFLDYALVCDLCEENGRRRPQCVDICPTQALMYISPKFPQHLERVHPDQKAEMLSKRLHPLAKDRFMRLPHEIWGENEPI
jgi:Fe-S-cluster-containing hydrogenase component 2